MLIIHSYSSQHTKIVSHTSMLSDRSQLFIPRCSLYLIRFSWKQHLFCLTSFDAVLNLLFSILILQTGFYTQPKLILLKMAKQSSFPLNRIAVGTAALRNTSQRKLLSRGATASFTSSSKAFRLPSSFGDHVASSDTILTVQQDTR